LANLAELAGERGVPLELEAAESKVFQVGDKLRVQIQGSPKTLELLEETGHLRNSLQNGFPTTELERLAEELVTKNRLLPHPDINFVDRLILKSQLKDIAAGRY